MKNKQSKGTKIEFAGKKIDTYTLQSWQEDGNGIVTSITTAAGTVLDDTVTAPELIQTGASTDRLQSQPQPLTIQTSSAASAVFDAGPFEPQPTTQEVMDKLDALIESLGKKKEVNKILEAKKIVEELAK